MQTTSQPSSFPPMLLTSREAAKLLNISERTLWQVTRDGKLPCIRIGRAVRYDFHDLHAFIAERKRHFLLSDEKRYYSQQVQTTEAR